MNNVFIVAFVSLLIISVSLYVRLYQINIRTTKDFGKLMITNIALQEYINQLEGNKIKSDESIHQENFIKFLSDSRDWAYSYIEEFQASMEKFIDAVDDDITYFDEFGDVISTNRPDYEAMKKISQAYKELIKVMPEDN